MQDNYLDQVVSHLQFLGYTLESREDGKVVLDHGRNPRLGIWTGRDGLRFVVGYSTKDTVHEDRVGFLEYINKFNRLAVLTKATGSEDAIIFEAWFPHLYEKERFGQFIEFFEYEVGSLPKHDDLKEGTAKYLF